MNPEPRFVKMFLAQMQQDGETKQFPVNGQGTFIYTRKFTGKDETGEFAIVVTPEKLELGEKPHEYIALHVTPTKASFEKMEKCGESGIEKEGIGSEPKRLLSYWFSYDRDACTVKYGKGYRMVETTLLSHDFLENESREQLEKFFNAAKPIYVMVFFAGEDELAVKTPLIEVESTFQFDENPLVGNYPPLVLDSDKVSLLDVDQNLFMFSSSLPLACKELYSNIRNMELEYPAHPDFPGIKLSDAIRYSLTTEGMMLANIIKKKQEKKKSDDAKSEVYIRVTLGPDMRTGPGVSYVLELWPSKCKSPVHNHGASCAVIKVLFGQIQIKIFNKGGNPPTTTDFIKKFDAVKDDVTWMDSNWYQSHQLVNTTSDYCATIQCYKYAAGDKIHWPGFDFVAVGEQEQEHVLDTFIPDSDATFQKMRNTVLKEYQDHLACKMQSEKV